MKCGLESMMVVLVVCLLGGCGGPAVVPTSFTSYESKDGSFKCDAPDGWGTSDQKGKDFCWVTFKSGSAKITLQANDLESLGPTLLAAGKTPAMFGPGVAEATATDISAPSPAATFHRIEQKRVAHDIDGFEEKSRAITVNPPIGICRQSESKATELRGCSATAVVTRCVRPRRTRNMASASCRSAAFPMGSPLTSTTVSAANTHRFDCPSAIRAALDLATRVA